MGRSVASVAPPEHHRNQSFSLFVKFLSGSELQTSHVHFSFLGLYSDSKKAVEHPAASESLWDRNCPKVALSQTLSVAFGSIYKCCTHLVVFVMAHCLQEVKKA